MYAIFISLCLLLSIEARELAPIIHENLIGDSIIDTKQIKIPGFPKLFNPSIVPYKDGYLLSFRIREHLPHQEKKMRIDASFIGLAQLDEQFKVLEKSVQILNITSYDSKFSFHAEDGRLFKVGNRIFLLFNDLHRFEERDGFAMYLAELVEEGGFMALKDPAIPLNYSSSIPVEKNWTPFISESRVYLIYSDQPRVILELDLNTGDCQEISRTEYGDLWDFGQVRGGSPACLVDDLFVTFFHTRFFDGENRIYIMGAYAFETQFPFSIRAVTPAPIGIPSYYQEDNSRKVVYPCGMIVEGDRIHVTWGRSDNGAYLTTFDKNKLMRILCPK
ncbi:MAG: hypothetical protein K1X28_06775 [Parachlamydiales bacterium]|nr:hypothetical protein [Parachlamydiales bacterium]